MFLKVKAGGILVYIVITMIWGKISHVGNCGYPASHVVLIRFARKLDDNKGIELIMIPRGHIKL
jgi:hypothetical protein